MRYGDAEYDPAPMLLDDGLHATSCEDPAWYYVSDGLCSEVQADGSLHYWWRAPHEIDGWLAPAVEAGIDVPEHARKWI